MLVTVKDLREALMREPNQNKSVHVIDGSELEVMVRRLYLDKEKDIVESWNKISTFKKLPCRALASLQNILDERKREK